MTTALSKKSLFLASALFAASLSAADPGTVKPLRSLIFPSGNSVWKSLAVHDGYLYTYSVADEGGALNIYALGGDSIRFVRSIPRETRFTGRPAFIGDTGYFCDGYSLSVCDLSTPERAEIVNSLALGFPVKTAVDVYAAGEMLVLSGSDGTRLYNASDSFAPVLTDFLPDFKTEAASAGYCLVRESPSECRLYSISKSGFEKLGSLPICTGSSCTFVSGGAVYETDSAVTRIHNISNPQKITSAAFTNAVLHPIYSGNTGKRIFSANECTLEEWDVSSPLKPIFRRKTDFPVGINESLCVSGGKYYIIDQTRKSISEYRNISNSAVKSRESFFAPDVSAINPEDDSAVLAYKSKVSFAKLRLPLDWNSSSLFVPLTGPYADFSSADIIKFSSPTDIPPAVNDAPAKAVAGDFTIARNGDGTIEVKKTGSDSTVSLLIPDQASPALAYKCFAVTNGNLYAVSGCGIDIYSLTSVTNPPPAKEQARDNESVRQLGNVESAVIPPASHGNREQSATQVVTDTTESPRGAVAVSGSTAFLGWTMETADGGVFIGLVSADVSNPVSPRIADAIPLPSMPCSIVADPSTNILYIADTLAITAVGFTTNGAMNVITDIPVSDSELKGPQQLAILQNGILAAACGKEGLLTAEITGGTNISVVAVFESAGFARAIAASSNTVFLCDSASGVTRFVCDSPEDAVRGRTRPLRKGAATAAFCLDGRLFAASTENPLTSLSADSRLRIISEYGRPAERLPSPASWVTSAAPFSANGKHYAVLAMANDGIMICDISSPDKIVPVSRLGKESFKAGDNFFSALCVAGGLLYAVDRNNGLFIVDITRPEAPELLSELTIR